MRLELEFDIFEKNKKGKFINIAILCIFENIKITLEINFTV
jgi:hypothetical protein